MCINGDEFWLWSYFLFLKYKLHVTSPNQRMEFFSNSSLHKLNTYETSWIHSKLFLQTGVNILRSGKILLPQCYQNLRKTRVPFIRCGIKFRQSNWIAEYIYRNTEQWQKARCDCCKGGYTYAVFSKDQKLYRFVQLFAE